LLPPRGLAIILKTQIGCAPSMVIVPFGGAHVAEKDFFPTLATTVIDFSRFSARPTDPLGELSTWKTVSCTEYPALGVLRIGKKQTFVLAATPVVLLTTRTSPLEEPCRPSSSVIVAVLFHIVEFNEGVRLVH
jgi:hypothetical protein